MGKVLTVFSRILLILTVFIAGVLTGNVLMPQQNLEAQDIVSLQAPQTSLDLSKEPSTEDALKALDEQADALLKTQSVAPENAFLWQDTIKKNILLQAYVSAKENYEIALLKVQNSPQEKDFFIQARNNYAKISDLISTLFPLIKDDIQIISAKPVTAALPPTGAVPLAVTADSLAATPSTQTAEAAPAAPSAQAPVVSTSTVLTTPAALTASTVLTTSTAVSSSTTVSTSNAASVQTNAAL